MASRTTICPSCQEAVPGGRLSCPSCGLLLASVAGAPPRRRTRKPTAPEPVAAVASEPKPAGAYVPPTTSPGPFLLPARAWAGITSASPRPMAGLGLGARPMATAGGAGSMSSGSTGGILVKVPTRPPTAPAPRPAAAAPAPQPATTNAPDVPHDAGEATWIEAAAGWLMIIGSAVAILGFLLPWSRTVIGAEGAGSYFDTWGIANPSHVLVVLALAAALGLAIVANPIPTWIRTCAVGLVLGGLLVGLTWPYLFGPLGAGPGVLAILVGGVMLAVAGILDLVEARHAQTDPLV
jgi:hypothetical protein